MSKVSGSCRSTMHVAREWVSRVFTRKSARGAFACLGHKRSPFPYENTPFGASMKRLSPLTDPSLKDGAFMSLPPRDDRVGTVELITQSQREKENTEVPVLLFSVSLFLCVISSAVPPRQPVTNGLMRSAGTARAPTPARTRLIPITRRTRRRREHRVTREEQDSAPI